MVLSGLKIDWKLLMRFDESFIKIYNQDSDEEYENCENCMTFTMIYNF